MEVEGDLDTGSQLRDWLPTVELGLAALASVLWYLQGGWVRYRGPWPGPWPLVLLGVMVALTARREGARAFRPSPLTVPLLAFLATVAVGFWAAYNPEIALAKVWLIVGAVGIYWALAHQPDRARMAAALGFWGVFCIVLPAYFLMTTDWAAVEVKIPLLTQLGATIAAGLPRVTAHRLNHNVAGGLIAMALPFTIALPAMAREIPGLGRTARRLLWVLGVSGLAVGLLGLLITVSRGAWNGAAGAGALWLTWRLTGRLGRRARLLVPAALLLGGAAVAVAGVWVLLEGRAVADVGPAVTASLRGAVLNRVGLLSLGALLARDTVFTGIGPGMFEMQLSIYALLIHVGYVEHSHNLLLDLAIEQGIAGAVTFVVMAATAYGWGIRAWGSGGPERDSGVAASADRARTRSHFDLLIEAALASLTVVMIHGMTDDVLYGTRSVLLLLAPFGILAASCRMRVRHQASGVRAERGVLARGRPRGWRGLACAQVALVVLLTGIGVHTILHIRGDGARASTAGPIAGRWRGAWHANLGATAQARTELSVYDPEHFHDLTIEAVRREEELDGALAHFERAVALDPTNPTAQQRLTGIALARGAYDEALAAMQVLWDAGYRGRITRLLYGDALVAAGRVEEAVAVTQGLEFARDRLLGQAWSRYSVGADPVREQFARNAAAAVEE